MQKIIFFLGLAILLFSCEEEAGNTINYTISPQLDKGESQLKIKMTTRAGADGETILLFQDNAWGQDSLHNVLASMKVLNAEAEITTHRDSGWVAIKHPRGLKELEFEYSIQQDTEGQLVTSETYRPVVQPEYFHVFSHNLFMLPREIAKTQGSAFDVHIKWEGFTDDYKLINSFGRNDRLQIIENTTEEKFHTAVFTGGDFRVYDLDINDNKVVFAIRGEWVAFNDSLMVDILQKTVRSQRDLWQDHSQDYFTVTMIPTVLERGSSYQGTGLTNSFAVNAANNQYLEPGGLVYLFNHELLHHWTGHIIKNVNEEEQYWFSEGFTDYYTLKNISKHNIMGMDKGYFISEFNTFIKELFTSPVNELPNKEITYETFWSGQEGMEKLPYQRGALFAFYLDQKINQDSQGEKSLDDVMLQIKRDALEKGQKIDHPYFINTVNQFLKEDITPFFRKHIEAGKLYDLRAIFDDLGLEFSPTANVFDLGFELSGDRERIETVDKESNAYSAGLRKGDKISGRSYYRSPERYAEFTVYRGGKEFTFSFLPARQAEIPQLLDTPSNREILNF